MLPLAPIETYAAEGLTGLFISAGAKGNAATIVKRANGVLAVVSAIQQLDSGNTTAGTVALTQALGTTDLDPGEALALQGLLSQLATQANLLNDVMDSTIQGKLASTVFNNIATGVTQAANAELAKYQAAAKTAETVQPEVLPGTPPAT